MSEINEIETFKARLNQSLELTAKVISDLEMREREIELFKNVRSSFEQTILVKDNEITQLKNYIEQLEKSRVIEKRKELIDSWAKKYNISHSQLTDVERILSTLETEEEISRFENLLGLSLSKEKMTPIPLTKTSEELVVEQFSNSGLNVAVSPEDRVKHLHKRLLTLSNN